MSFRDNIRQVVPYVPGEQPKQADVIKLNTNENPYPPSPKVGEALRALDPADFRKYPDPAAGGLVHAIAERYGLRDSEVFVGVGSDDVLAMCFQTFFCSEKPVLFPDVTYSFYDVWADLFRIPYERIPLDGSFRIVPEDYEKPNGGVIFPNPNAPTGVLLSLEEVERIVASNPDSVVIVDEAYIDFGGESALPLIRRYQNLVVVQTFSKSRSMAGVRIGFAMADEELIRALENVKYSFNSYTISRPALAVGTASIKDEAYFRDCCRRICATRDETARAMRAMGFSMTDSASNFLFVSYPGIPGGDLFAYLRSKRIYVRWWDKPVIRDYLRITVGTDDEMKTLLAALGEYLKNRGAV